MRQQNKASPKNALAEIEIYVNNATFFALFLLSTVTIFIA